MSLSGDGSTKDVWAVLSIVSCARCGNVLKSDLVRLRDDDEIESHDNPCATGFTGLYQGCSCNPSPQPNNGYHFDGNSPFMWDTRFVRVPPLVAEAIKEKR